MPFLACVEEKKNCPFRIIDIKKNNVMCNFYQEYWKVYNNKFSIEVKTLFNRACQSIRDYENYQQHISKIHKKNTIEMLKRLEINDTLFWISHSEDVILIEKPSELDMFTKCKCKRYNDKIVDIPAYLLRKISMGKYYSDYFIGKDETKLRELEHRIKLYGFRPEKKESSEGYLLRIYGNSKREVDHFINLFIEQDLELI